MLGFILFLIVLNIFLLLPLRNYGAHTYLVPMVTLMLLFNHIAYHIHEKRLDQPCDENGFVDLDRVGMGLYILALLD